MSRTVLTGPLLDFGRSYWGSTLCQEEHPALATAKFEPIGRYGIGFFSVFMWGEHVRVTTRRPADAARETRVLEFRTGLHARPLLRQANRDEQLAEGGTRVRVWLKHDPEGDQGLLRRDWRTEQPWSLSQLCSWIAPALEVDLCVEVRGKTQRVVQASDWKTLPSQALLERISGSRLEDIGGTSSWLEQLAENLRPVHGSNGELLGRACLAPQSKPWPQDDEGIRQSSPGVVVVGGLRAGWLTHISGLLLGRPSRADRMSAVPLARGESLALWATEQAQLLKHDAISGPDLAEDAGVLFFLGGNVTDLPIAECATGWLTLHQITEQFADTQELTLVQDAAVFNFRHSRGEFALGPGVLSVGTGWPGILQSERRIFFDISDNWPLEEHLDTQKHADSRSGVGAVVHALASAWGISADSIWQASQFSSDRAKVVRCIGTIDGKPVSCSVNVIRRPH